MLTISDTAMSELEYMFTNFELINGHPIRASLLRLLASDASEIGNCVYEISKDGNTVLHKRYCFI